MSEVRLVIREAEQDWSGIVHGGEADHAIAALSADPTTLAELEVALGRYRKLVAGSSFFANRSAGICDEPHDAGLIVIDLVARLVVTDSSYSSPGPDGDVLYHDGHSATDKWIRYHLAENWLFVDDRTIWRAIADERREEIAARPPLDARSVFYGRPLLEFVIREIFATHTGNEAMEVDPEETIRKLHIAWLMTPRDDLGGLCPREMVHLDHKRLEWDLQHQADRWSHLDECPPGLDESSFAFRYGGFGTHELVKYYDLVRELL